MLTSSHLGSDVQRVDLKYAAAAGMLNSVTWLRKFAVNRDIDTGTEQMWPLGTIQVLPTVAGVVSLVSDNAADTLLGTGAQKILVQGVDANYNAVSEEVDMDGVTPSVSTTSFLRVFRMYNTQTGTDEINQGNITASIGGNPQSYIAAQDGQTLVSQYTVPAGCALLIVEAHANSGRIGNGDLEIKLQKKQPGEGWRTIVDLYPYEGEASSDVMDLVPEKTDIRGLAVSTVVNLNMSLEYEGFLIRLNPFQNS